MARKRMLSALIIDSDAFLDMPLSAQALYMHLNMRADDDGFVGNPKRIQQYIGASSDDLKLLLAKRFILAFENGVIVIKHWKMHNTIQKDRYTPTAYQDELSRLVLNENNSYSDDVYKMETKCIHNVSTGLDIGLGIGIDKGLDIDKGKEKDINTSTESDKQTTVLLSGIKLPLVDKTVYDVPIPNIEMWKEAFPAVDVEGELFRMNAWLNSNPLKRKTRRGINRFINTWLSKVQDKGGSKYIPKPTIKKQVEEEQALDLWGDD